MAVIGSDLIKTLDVIEKIEVLGRAVGNTDPCNPIKTVEILIEMIIQLGIDLYNGVIAIAKLAGKNALFIILVLLQEMLGPILLAGMDSILGFLMGNVLGTILQAIALLLSSLEGIWLILMYLAAGQTMTSILERQTFLRNHVVPRIVSLINLFTMLQNMDWGEEFLDNFTDVRAAYDHVYTAGLILGTQIEGSGAIVTAESLANSDPNARVADFQGGGWGHGGGGISIPELTRAHDELGEAIDILFGGQYGAMLNMAEGMFNAAGLTTNGAQEWGQVFIPDSLLDDVEFAEEFGIEPLDAANELFNDGGTIITLTWSNFDTILKNLWHAAGNSGKVLKWEEFIGDLPPFIRIIALQTVVDEGMADLAKKVPMFGAGIADSLKLLNKLAEDNSLDTMKILHMSKDDEINLGQALEQLRDQADRVEDFTLKKVNDKVNMSEAAILLLKHNFFTCSWVGQMVALALVPMLQELAVVREDMKSSLNISQDKMQAEAYKISSFKKVQWGTQLEMIRLGLKTFTTGINIPGMGEMNFLDDSNAQAVEQKWDNLVQTLSDLPDRQPAEIAYDLLQELPGKAFKTAMSGGSSEQVVTEITSTTTSIHGETQTTTYQLPDVSNDLQNNSPEEFLAFLQDIRYNLNQSLTIDTGIYDQRNSVRNLIEQNDSFEAMMALWDQLTAGLEGPFGALGSDLAAGNLNSLVNALSEFTAAFSVIGVVGNCVKEAFADPMAAANISLDPDLNPAEFQMQNAQKKAAAAQKKASDALLGALSGISDDNDFREFLERKEQLKTQFLNESAKLNDVLARLTMLYTLLS